MIKLHGKPPNCKFSSIGPTLPLEKEIKLHLCSAQSWLTSLSPSTHHHPHSFLTDCSLSLIKMQRKNDITTRTVQKAYYFGPLIEFRTKKLVSTMPDYQSTPAFAMSGTGSYFYKLWGQYQAKIINALEEKAYSY